MVCFEVDIDHEIINPKFSVIGHRSMLVLSIMEKHASSQTQKKIGRFEHHHRPLFSKGIIQLS
jgi:hypothetical protein